jgi:hypothetical protein
MSAAGCTDRDGGQRTQKRQPSQQILVHQGGSLKTRLLWHTRSTKRAAKAVEKIRHNYPSPVS